ncbi:MAG: flavin reductase family protein [Flavobacteriaceae bacterium]
MKEKSMRHFTEKEIQNFDKIYRLNLINSITGYKSANLIATQSARGDSNLAVFSSITHLGSDPALLGFILRPTTVPRHTYSNLKETGWFTVNHISADVIEDAHHTSAKYPAEVSEFDQTQLEVEYKEDQTCPFVKNAPVQILCNYLNEYPIAENGTILIVGKMNTIYVESQMVQEDGWVQLDKGKVVSINGLDGYALPQLLDRFEYARPKKI